jgi:hypothetical protein
MANEYYMHDKANGEPQRHAQLWRDSHTVDQLADKIRMHLERTNSGLQLTTVRGALLPLTLLEYQP